MGVTPTMNFSRSIKVILLGLYIAIFSGCATPGQTKANYLLQGDIQNMINANELAHGHIFGGRVVDTKAVSTEGLTVIEHWIVKRGDHNVIYEVKLTPSPRGGTDIEITLPEEDRQ
jgi:hypothetical protein